MRLGSWSNWFYFNGEKFREITKVGKKTNKEYEVPDDKIAGKILFEGVRSDGSIGGIYKASSNGLIKLEEPPVNRNFIDLFYPSVISHEEREGLFRLLDWGREIKKLIPSHVERVWYSRAVEDALNRPSRYLSRILGFWGSSRKMRCMSSILGVTKLLHQIFVSFKIVRLWYGSEIIDKQLNFKQDMRSGNEVIDSLMPVSWGGPTFRFKHGNDIYSIWHEFSAPYPFFSPGNLNARSERKSFSRKEFSALSSYRKIRFDLIVQKGEINSMFFEKPRVESRENVFKVPRKYFEKMQTIDLLIECKEQRFETWRSDVENQIIPYKRVYDPKQMVLVSARNDIPKLARSRLEENGIKVVAPFGPGDTPYEQGVKLMESLERI